MGWQLQGRGWEPQEPAGCPGLASASPGLFPEGSSRSRAWQPFALQPQRFGERGWRAPLQPCTWPHTGLAHGLSRLSRCEAGMGAGTTARGGHTGRRPSTWSAQGHHGGCWWRGWPLARPPKQGVTAKVMKLPRSEGVGQVWTLKPARRGQAPQIPGPSGPGGKHPAVPGAAPPSTGQQRRQ